MKLYEKLLEQNPNNFFTKNMKHEEWLEKRRNSIGGSDAGAIMELNKWASPLTVYLDKKGLNNFKGNVATARGNWLEAPIRERCREELGVLIEEVPYMFLSNSHPFMSANIDGLIYIQEKKEIAKVELSGLGGHEIKTSEFGDGFDDDEVPDSYFAQCQHYMAVLNLKWFVLSAYIINKHTLKHYIIQRDEAFILKLIEKETEFWNEFVEKNIMPAPLGLDSENELISDMFEGASKTLILDDEAESLAAEYLLINEEIKSKESRKKQIAAKLKLKLIEKQDGGDEVKVKAVAGNYNFSYSQFMRKSIDTDKLKKLGLYDQYCKESQSSTFRITEKKA